jgi:hypothetical protein
MNDNGRFGQRKIFDETTIAQLPHRVARVIQAVWPELGHPKQTIVEEDVFIVMDGRDYVEVRVFMENTDEIYIGLEVSPQKSHVNLPDLTSLLQQIEGHWRWHPVKEQSNPRLRLYTLLESQPFNMLKEATLEKHFAALHRWCDILCPVKKNTSFDSAALIRKYESFKKTLQPLFPWPDQKYIDSDEINDFVDQVFELISASFPVSVCAESSVERRLALTLVAERGLMVDKPLGQLTLSSISHEKLLRLAKEAPGFVIVPARALEMSTSPYERGDNVRHLLTTMTEEFTPCIFEGSYEDLQIIFSGGQGAKNDPLIPAVCRVPEIPIDILSRFVLWDVAQRLDLPLPMDIDASVKMIKESLESNPSKAYRLLNSVAEKILHGQTDKDTLTAFAGRLSGYSETYGSLETQQKVKRLPEVQHRFLTRLVSREFKQFLASRIYGQDRALSDYVAKIQEEVLTHPLHQPLVVALQGCPGTGKSESLSLTAEYLKIPYIVIDAASIPDTYTGMAQLLGSGRGIVGSFQSGRLEQIAKHHTGVILEVADLDHAPSSVRSSLADLFLNIIQNGQVQTATGALIGCSNFLIGFTLNLPNGQDERIYNNRMGFGNAPTYEEVQKDVRKEVKNMLSSAFVSRAGDPILYAPLSRDARLAIAKVALKNAALMGLDRSGMSGVQIEIEESAMEAVVSFDSGAITFGARGVVDKSRWMIVKALLSWLEEGVKEMPETLSIQGDDTGNLVFMKSKAKSTDLALTN